MLNTKKGSSEPCDDVDGPIAIDLDASVLIVTPEAFDELPKISAPLSARTLVDWQPTVNETNGCDFGNRSSFFVVGHTAKLGRRSLGRSLQLVLP